MFKENRLWCFARYLREMRFLIFVLLLFSCASTNKDAIRRQEDLIKSHPTWKGHDFGFKKRKPEFDGNEIIKTINEEKKNNSIPDTILIIKSKD